MYLLLTLVRTVDILVLACIIIGVGTDLLRGNVKRNSPQVDLTVVISAGKDEEYSRAAHTALITEPAKAEDDGALILLHHFEAGPHTDGESHNQSDDAY